MKRSSNLIAAGTFALFALYPLLTSAQGTFIYDQQSSLDETPPSIGAGPSIQSQLPSAGQSFIPTLTGVDFIRLNFDDPDISDGLGASIYLNLRSTGIAGPVLATSAEVAMVNGFSGPVTFFFPARAPVSPGTTYYFDLILTSAAPWNVDLGSFNYQRGTAFKQGVAYPGGDYWFREGIIVPEPTSAALLLLASFLLAVRRKPST